MNARAESRLAPFDPTALAATAVGPAALATVRGGVPAREAPPARTSAAERAIERRRFFVVMVVTSPWREALRGPSIAGAGRRSAATGAARRIPNRATGPLRWASA